VTIDLVARFQFMKPKVLSDAPVDGGYKKETA